MKRLSDLSFALLVLLLVPAAPAYAYLDAATVSMVLQVITGAVASVLLYGKMNLARLAGLFRRKSPAAPAAPAAPVDRTDG